MAPGLNSGIILLVCLWRKLWKISLTTQKLYGDDFKLEYFLEVSSEKGTKSLLLTHLVSSQGPAQGSHKSMTKAHKHTEEYLQPDPMCQDTALSRKEWTSSCGAVSMYFLKSQVPTNVWRQNPGFARVFLFLLRSMIWKDSQVLMSPRKPETIAANKTAGGQHPLPPGVLTDSPIAPKCKLGESMQVHLSNTFLPGPNNHRCF